MKKTLLNLALVASLGFTFAQTPGISNIGVYDNFVDANPTNAGVNQFSVITNEALWDTITHQGDLTKKAYKGIFWWTKRTDGKGLDFTKVRSGNGVQTYTVNQAASSYEPFGVGFGTYATSATDSSFFTVDLTNNAVVSFTIKNTSASAQFFKVGLGDITDTLLNAYAGPLDGYNGAPTGADISTENNDEYNAPYYLYELGFSVAAGASKDVSIDFKGGAHVFYRYNDGTLRKDGNIGCKDVPYYTSASTFNFAKVKSFTITPLNGGADLGGPAPECYGKPALAAGTFEISNFKIGDITTIVGISDETIASFNNEVVTVYNFSGAVVAQGKLADLNLTSGFYILKSASKTQKIMIK